MNEMSNDGLSVKSNQSINSYDFRSKPPKSHTIFNNKSYNDANNNFGQILLKDNYKNESQKPKAYNITQTNREIDLTNNNFVIQDSIYKNNTMNEPPSYKQNTQAGNLSIFDLYPPSKINQMMEHIDICSMNDFDKLPNA